MKREVYRGVVLKVTKGRQWGYLSHHVNGTRVGDWLGMDEQAAINGMKPYVDLAISEPGRMSDYWQPGYKVKKEAQEA